MPNQQDCTPLGNRPKISPLITQCEIQYVALEMNLDDYFSVVSTNLFKGRACIEQAFGFHFFTLKPTSCSPSFKNPHFQDVIPEAMSTYFYLFNNIVNI